MSFKKSIWSNLLGYSTYYATVYVIDSGLLKSGVGELDGRDDLVAVGMEGKSSIEDGVKVRELGDFGDGESRGLVEDDDFRLEGGNGEVVAFTGRLSSVNEGLYGGGGVTDETEVVHVEKDGEEVMV